jgi:hypothetical protein
VDLLSPLPFVIVMEALNRMMVATEDRGLVDWFSMGSKIRQVWLCHICCLQMIL